MRPLEKEVQRAVVAVLTLAGCRVYSTSQGYRKDPGGARTTPGIPDLLVFHGARFCWFEVKRPKPNGQPEPLRPAQQDFRLVAQGSGQLHVWGGVWQAQALLIDWGLGAWEGKTFRVLTRASAGRGSPSTGG